METRQYRVNSEGLYCDIPLDLKRKFQTKCINSNLKQKKVIKDLIEEWVEQDKKQEVFINGESENGEQENRADNVSVNETKKSGGFFKF